MLDVNPDTVRFIIDKARAFQVKEGVTIPEEPLSPSDDADDPALAEIRSTIEDLEPDQQVALVALMWVGRGDYGIEEWGDALAQAGESWNARTADYLIGTPLLADYLEEGLELVG
jgi:hypothetical protein